MTHWQKVDQAYVFTKSLFLEEVVTVKRSKMHPTIAQLEYFSPLILQDSNVRL